MTAIEQRIYPFPWTRGNFVDSLKAGHSAWVCREGGAMVGYAVLMMTVDEARTAQHHRRCRNTSGAAWAASC